MERKQEDRLYIFNQNREIYKTEVKTKVDQHRNQFAEEARSKAK